MIGWLDSDRIRRTDLRKSVMNAGKSIAFWLTLVTIGCYASDRTYECIQALEKASNNAAMMAGFNQATATVSLEASKTLGSAYAADIGSYDECMAIPGAHHCLAGSVKKIDR